jgi:hypothetical protein
MAITSSKNPDLSPGERAALDRLTGGGAVATGGGKVYMGSQRYLKSGGQKYGLGEEGVGQPRYGKKPVWASEDEAYQDFFSWGQKKQRDFLAQGIVGGMLKLGDGPMEASKLWKKLVKEAAAYGKSGKKVTPFDIMASYVGGSGGGSKEWVRQGDFEVNVRTGERRYVGPQFKTQTDTRVDLTDPDTARAVASKLFQDLMGRDPGAGELGSFASALHSAEEQSPVVSTTTTEYDMTTGEPVGTSTQQQGGLTADARAYIGEQQIKKKKEYGAFQAATTYQNALDALVFGGPE